VKKEVRRWGIAFAAVVTQSALGGGYAWSVFKAPLMKQFHWSSPDVTLTFTICVALVGVSSFFGGFWMGRKGPRVVALTGGFLYGFGVFLSSFSAGKLWFLYLSYGVIAGVGLGLSYIVPVAVLLRWFPDRRGLLSGIAAAGFGAGALITAPLAARLIQRVGVSHAFAWVGIGYLVVVMISALFMENPPEAWSPVRRTQSIELEGQQYTCGFELVEALATWQFWALWLMMFLNTAAGISLISQEVPVYQELTRASAIVAASMVGIASIGNAAGRILWAAISDLITRRWTIATIFLVQMALFWTLPRLSSIVPVTLVAFLILMCYGGGFGTLPAFTADYFGSRNLGSIYGLILTGGAAGSVGPWLMANLRQASGSYVSGLHWIAAMIGGATLLPLLTVAPRRRW